MQLPGSHTWHLEEVRSWQCQLTMPEYTTLANHALLVTSFPLARDLETLLIQQR